MNPNAAIGIGAREAFRENPVFGIKRSGSDEVSTPTTLGTPTLGCVLSIFRLDGKHVGEGVSWKGSVRAKYFMAGPEEKS